MTKGDQAEAPRQHLLLLQTSISYGFKPVSVHRVIRYVFVFGGKLPIKCDDVTEEKNMHYERELLVVNDVLKGKLRRDEGYLSIEETAFNEPHCPLACNNQPLP